MLLRQVCNILRMHLCPSVVPMATVGVGWLGALPSVANIPEVSQAMPAVSIPSSHGARSPWCWQELLSGQFRGALCLVEHEYWAAAFSRAAGSCSHKLDIFLREFEARKNHFPGKFIFYNE